MNALWSYAYARRVEMDAAIGKFQVPTVRFFADSGAHSARTLGIHLDTDLYGAWLRKWHRHFTIYANLDVIYGPEATYANQQSLEQQGLSPMPVFHTGEPFRWLERYLDEGYTYIALGKLLGNPWSKIGPWLDRCFRLADGRAVFHGFGLTAWPAIRAFPFYSVDSSSWTGAFRFGTLRLFHRGRWVSVRLRDRTDVLAHRAILEEYGVPVRGLTRAGYSKVHVARASALSFARAGEYVAKRHGPIHLPPGKGYPSGSPIAPVAPAAAAGRFHLYLAESSIAHHLLHAEAVRKANAA